MEALRKKIVALKVATNQRADIIKEKEEQLERLIEENEIWKKKNADLQAQFEELDVELDTATANYKVVQNELSEAEKANEIMEGERQQLKMKIKGNEFQHCIAEDFKEIYIL